MAMEAAREVGRDWREAHEALVRIAQRRTGLDYEEGPWLRAALRARTYERLGYGSFFEYVERLFGYSPRLTQDKLRVAEALEALPAAAQALRSGAASWSCLRELTRVATAETEQTWLDAAQGRTVREVEQLVSGHRPGQLPNEPREWVAERHVLRFEVSGEVLATFREAMAKLRREAAGPLDDDALLLLLARQILAGPADDGRASYQVALAVCPECERATQSGRGDAVTVAPEVVEMARCDAQEIRAHVGGAPGRRATQAVPPAVRRGVLRRDQHRCRVPGCRHATFVDVHHLLSREQGGGHETDNLLTLCSAHHRACHRGELSIEGQASSELIFRHSHGTPYGGVVSVTGAELQTRAFQALRRLGFGERETRAALSQALAHVGANAELEVVLRRALETLTAGALAVAS